jgi:hypothetical protein
MHDCGTNHNREREPSESSATNFQDKCHYDQKPVFEKLQKLKTYSAQRKWLKSFGIGHSCQDKIIHEYKQSNNYPLTEKT